LDTLAGCGHHRPEAGRIAKPHHRQFEGNARELRVVAEFLENSSDRDPFCRGMGSRYTN
jgi:hypothetical protein